MSGRKQSEQYERELKTAGQPVETSQAIIPTRAFAFPRFLFDTIFFSQAEIFLPIVMSLFFWPTFQALAEA